MNQKIPFHELAKKIAVANSISDESAEVFVRNFFDLLGEIIISGDTVRIKGLGSFSPVEIAGERVVEFNLDKDISDTINAPFAPFEPIELNDDVTDEMLSSVEIEKPSEEPLEEPKEEPLQSQSLVTENVQSESTASIVEPPLEEEIKQEKEEIEELPKTADVEQEPEKEIIENDAEVENVMEEQSNELQPQQSAEHAVETAVEKGISKKNAPTTIDVLEEEPEEYVEHVTSDNESSNGGFGWGFLVGLLVGLALGACAVYLAIDYIFPYGRIADSEEDKVIELAAQEIPAEGVGNMTDSLSSVSADTLKQAVSDPIAVVVEEPVEEPVKAVRCDTVRRGYLIHDMSKKYYGTKEFWVYIYEENKSKIGNPNKMQPGDVLVIPEPEKYGINASSSESLKKARNKAGEILSKYK